MKGNINLISYDCYQQATEKQLAGLKWKENRVYYISEMLRKSYLQEHRKAKYQILLLQGKLVEHLNQIDAEARDREEQLVKQMMEKQGITEKLKRQDNMEWTRRMNAICHDAEEMILTEMIYTKG